MSAVATRDLEAEALAGHVLVPVDVSARVRAWYLRRPGEGRMMSTLVLESPEGIIICGDLCPRDRGVISDLGYGAAWFAGELSPDYLCSKFLRKEWVPDAARARLLDLIAEAVREGDLSAEAADAHSAEVRNEHDLSPDRAREIFESAGLTEFSDYDWNAYDPNDVRWLVAIQRRFRVLYHAAHPTPASAAGAAERRGETDEVLS